VPTAGGAVRSHHFPEAVGQQDTGGYPCRPDVSAILRLAHIAECVDQR